MIRSLNPPKAFLVLMALALLAAAVIALPGLHQALPPRIGHYRTTARQLQAQQARAIIANSQNPCKLYRCNTGDLRVCIGELDTGEVVQALQWLFFADGEWLEGTSFIQSKPHKVRNYLGNNGCVEVVQ